MVCTGFPWNIFGVLRGDSFEQKEFHKGNHHDAASVSVRKHEEKGAKDGDSYRLTVLSLYVSLVGLSCSTLFDLVLGHSPRLVFLLLSAFRYSRIL